MHTTSFEINPELAITVFILLIGLCAWLFSKFKIEQKKKELLVQENSLLIADNALFEAEQLKFQLQPHTLNNILTNLKLIANKLNKGMDAFSQTLEYILYKGNTHLVSIEDEINFIKKYLDLNDLFIAEIDSIQLDKSGINTHSKYFTAKCIPHLVTAYLIENAFKHGDVNHPDFLKIQLKLTDVAFEMKVINKIRQKPIKINGGIGLSNMRKRLDLLMLNKYEIKNNCTEQEYYSNLTIRFKND